MKLSDQTSSFLENFSKINSGIVIQPGTIISTISPSGNLIASANISEEFESSVCIYNLPEFLNIKNLFPDATLKIDATKISLESQSGAGATIVQSQPNLISNLNGKTVPEQDVIAEFILENNILFTIPKMQLSLPHVSISNNNNKIVLRILDLKNPSSTVLEYVVGETDQTFEAHLSSELFSKVLKTETNYKVLITKAFLKLSNEKIPVSYWFSYEKSSKV